MGDPVLGQREMPRPRDPVLGRRMHLQGQDVESDAKHEEDDPTKYVRLQLSLDDQDEVDRQ